MKIINYQLIILLLFLIFIVTFLNREQWDEWDWRRRVVETGLKFNTKII